MTLLPPNTSALERAIEQALTVPALPVPLRDIWDADTCPIAVLPWLAWSLSIDTWSPDWPEAVQRSRVASAIDIQRRKGTAKSVRDVVESLGGQIALREWWQTEPKGEPHTFSINLNINDATGAPASAAYIDAVIDDIRRTKPARSHFEFIQGLGSVAEIGLKAVARVATYTRLTMTAPAAS